MNRNDDATKSQDESKQDKLPHKIEFFLDGERETTTQAVLTPNQIITDFGHKLTTAYYLVQVQGGRQTESYKDKGEQPITLRNGEHFQLIAIGPTPLSDPQLPRTGVAVFAEGLQQLGFVPAFLKQHADHLFFEYKVQSGRLLGREVRLGFQVPADFPLIPPSGLNVSPHVHPINPSQDGTHPTFAIHEAQAKPFEKEVGGSWQYWSRPFPQSEWASSKKTAAIYMAHVWRLWDTQ